jgi:hypothetical protein
MGISKLMQSRVNDAPHEDERPPSLDPVSAVPAVVEPAPSPVIRKPRKSKPKPIKDTKLRKVVGLILALRVQGKSRAEIAEELELTENTVKTYLYRAKKKGLIDSNSFDDPNDVLDTVIKPKVVENIEALLAWKNPKTGLPSMDMTIETAKGIGVFQTHQVQKGGTVQNANAFALKVQIHMPPNAQGALPDARLGTMGGRMAVDAEIVESEE